MLRQKLPCERPAAEQRYIRSMLAVFGRLSPEKKEEIRALIARLCRTSEEGRALFGILVQDKTIPAAAAATGVSIRRLSELRREFFEQARL